MKVISIQFVFVIYCCLIHFSVSDTDAIKKPTEAITSLNYNITSAPNVTNSPVSLTFHKVEMSLNRDFTVVYNDKTSVEYIALENEAKKFLTDSLKRQKGFDSVVINGFRQGSIIVDSTVIYTSPVDVTVTQDVIKKATLDNPALKINVDKIVVIEVPPTLQTTTAAMIYLMNLKMTLDQTFNTTLNDKASYDYIKLKTDIETFVNGSMANETGYKQIIINSFQNGSIIVDITLGFTEKKTASALETKLKESAKTNTNLKIIKISVSDPSDTSSPGNDNWWIPLIIALSIIIVGLVMLCLVILIIKKRKLKAKRVKINKKILEEKNQSSNTQTSSNRFNRPTTNAQNVDIPLEKISTYNTQNRDLSKSKIDDNYKNQDPTKQNINRLIGTTPVKKSTSFNRNFESDDSINA